jgi:HlyD family secretion protein
MNYTYRRLVATGIATLVLLVLGLGLWGGTATISGAIVAQGRVAPAGQTRLVEHQDGGTVRELHVSEGQSVHGGEVIAVFDDLNLRESLAILSDQRIELEAKAARLLAERDGLAAPVFSDELLATASRTSDAAAAIEGQRQLFVERARSHAGTLQAQRSQIAQVENEVVGLTAQRLALAEQLELVETELAAVSVFVEKGLAETSRAMSLRREKARIEGQIGEVNAASARAEGRIAEISVSMLLAETARREQALAELRELEAQLIELRGRERATLAALERLTVVAPLTGTVHDLRVHAPGDVVRPAEPILTIVPTGFLPVVEAAIDIRSVDSIGTGQPAILRLSALDSGTSPEVSGRVVRVSADSMRNEATGEEYYSVELRFDPDSLDSADRSALVAGMPVDILIRTADRPAISYILKPLATYFGKALRD